MDLFAFVGWSVTVVTLVTLPWPLNVPLMALAYKVRRGTQPVDLEPREFWYRSALAALGPAVLSLVLLFVGYLLIVRGQFPAGATLLVLLMAYLPAAVGYVFWSYGMEEMLDGLGVFLVYLLLPGLPLLLLAWLFGLWAVLRPYVPWLIPS